MKKSIKKIFCLVLSVAFLFSIVFIPKTNAQSSGSNISVLNDCESNPFGLWMLQNVAAGEIYTAPTVAPFVDTSDFAPGSKASISGTLQAIGNAHEGYLGFSRSLNVDLSQKHILSFWAKYSYFDLGNGETPVILITTATSWMWWRLDVVSTSWQRYEFDLARSPDGGSRQMGGFVSFQDSLAHLQFFGIGYYSTDNVVTLQRDLTIHIDAIEYGYPGVSFENNQQGSTPIAVSPIAVNPSVLFIGLAVIVGVPIATVIYSVQKKPKYRHRK